MQDTFVQATLTPEPAPATKLSKMVDTSTGGDGMRRHWYFLKVPVTGSGGEA